MRYVVVPGLLGLTFAALALHPAEDAVGLGRGVTAFEALSSLICLSLAAVYGLGQAGYPVERAFRGRGPARAVALPYQAAIGLIQGVSRRLGGEAPMDPVAPGLYIGRLPDRSEHPRLAAAGIGAVLNLCVEFPGLHGIPDLRGIETGRVPILDGLPPTPAQFRAAIEWVAARREEGKVVLIHCAQGHGRSATVAAAALCRLGLATGPDAALALIRAARPRARPSRGQLAALVRFLAA